MGIIQRQGIQTAFFTYAGVVLGYLNMVWLFPQHLEGDQFGLTRLIIALSTVVSEIGRVGTPNLVVRYFPAFRSPSNGHHGILRLLMIVCSIGSALLLLGLWLGETFILRLYEPGDAALLAQNYGWFLFTTLFIVFSETLFAYSRSLLRQIMPVFVKETLLRLLQTAIILAYAAGGYGFEWFMALFACTFGVQNVVMLVYLARIGELKLSWRVRLPDNLSGKELLSYSFFMTLNKIPSTAIVHVDVIMVSAMIDLYASGVYAIAVFISAIVRIPGRLINMISAPLVANHFQQNNVQEINKLYQQTAVTQFIIGAGLSMLLLVNFHSLILFIPEGYHEIFYLLLWLSIGNVIDMATGINGIIIANSRYYKFDLYANAVLVTITVLSNVWLIPLLGMVGAAIATALSLAIYNLLKLVFLYRKYQMFPFNKAILLAMVAVAVAAVVGWIIPSLQFPILDITVRSFLSAGILIALIKWWNVAPELTDVLTKVGFKTK